tara:strand:- start:332 stop:727 length:396 start_codon:yes stop_codon:yes gene_type:complete
MAIYGNDYLVASHNLEEAINIVEEYTEEKWNRAETVCLRNKVEKEYEDYVKDGLSWDGETHVSVTIQLDEILHRAEKEIKELIDVEVDVEIIKGSDYEPDGFLIHEACFVLGFTNGQIPQKELSLYRVSVE